MEKQLSHTYEIFKKSIINFLSNKFIKIILEIIFALSSAILWEYCKYKK